MSSQNAPRYVMISSEIRNDLEGPLSHFTRLELHHLYNRAPWRDMRVQDFGPRTARFRTPVDLYWQLERIQPDIIQGPEPFSLRMLPYLLAVYAYLVRHPSTKLVTLSLEPIPLEKKYHPLAVPIFRAVLRRWFARAALIFWFDSGSRDNLLAYGAPKDKLVEHLYGSWGVNLDSFNPQGPRVRYPQSKPVILYLGRLVETKGVSYLIDAYRRLRDTGLDAYLAVAGDGPERVSLEAQARATGYGEDIIFHGRVKNVDVPMYMRAADIFALPSVSSKLWVQQISMTAWQAMACGLPVVATDTGRMAEFTPPETGVLVPERSPSDMAEALGHLLDDSDFRRRLACGALTYARRRFDDRQNVLRAQEMVLDRCIGTVDEELARNG